MQTGQPASTFLALYRVFFFVVIVVIDCAALFQHILAAGGVTRQGECEVATGVVGGR